MCTTDVDMCRLAHMSPQARTLYREARLHEGPVPTPKRMKPDSPAEPGCSSMGGDAGARGAGGVPQGATASGSGRRVGSDNPLMQSQASYIQIMGWVSEFLRHDTRYGSVAFYPRPLLYTHVPTLPLMDCAHMPFAVYACSRAPVWMLTVGAAGRVPPDAQKLMAIHEQVSRIGAISR